MIILFSFIVLFSTKSNAYMQSLRELPEEITDNAITLRKLKEERRITKIRTASVEPISKSKRNTFNNPRESVATHLNPNKVKQPSSVFNKLNFDSIETKRESMINNNNINSSRSKINNNTNTLVNSTIPKIFPKSISSSNTLNRSNNNEQNNTLSKRSQYKSNNNDNKHNVLYNNNQDDVIKENETYNSEINDDDINKNDISNFNTSNLNKTNDKLRKATFVTKVNEEASKDYEINVDDNKEKEDNAGKKDSKKGLTLPYYSNDRIKYGKSNNLNSFKVLNDFDDEHNDINFKISKNKTAIL